MTSTRSMGRNKPPVGLCSRTATILLAPPGAKCALERMAKGVEGRPASSRDAPPPPSPMFSSPCGLQPHLQPGREDISADFRAPTYVILGTVLKSDFLSFTISSAAPELNLRKGESKRREDRGELHDVQQRKLFKK